MKVSTFLLTYFWWKKKCVFWSTEESKCTAECYPDQDDWLVDWFLIKNIVNL